MVFVRKVEQIQELAARREGLQVQVIDSLSAMIWQIEQDFVNEKPGLSIEPGADHAVLNQS